MLNINKNYLFASLFAVSSVFSTNILAQDDADENVEEVWNYWLQPQQLQIRPEESTTRTSTNRKVTDFLKANLYSLSVV